LKIQFKTAQVELRSGRVLRSWVQVVGNSMNLFDTENGPHIDKYDAVFRFNSEWRRMFHVTKDTKVGPA